MDATNIVVAVMAALGLVMALFARWIRLHWIKEPLLALLLGVLIGPAGLGWFDLARYGDAREILEAVARFTLAIALVSVGVELRGYLARAWRSLVVLLFGGTALMWAVSTLLVWLILGLDPLLALLIGAVLAPIDPILTAAVVAGKIARENVPEHTRRLLSAESAGRHGLGLLFVLLPAFLLTKPAAEAWTHWLTVGLLWKGVLAVVVGGGVGYLVGRVQAWSAARGFADSATGPLAALFLALSLTLVAAVELMDSDGVLAVLVAGIAFMQGRAGAPKSEALEQQDERYEALVKQLLQVPVFTLLGVALPWAAWGELGWSGFALVMGVLLVRRIPAVLFLKPLVRAMPRWDEALFVGWFGPIGVGALYFAAVAHRETGVEQVWTIATLLIAVTIVLHDLTTTPFSQWLARREGKQPRE